MTQLVQAPRRSWWDGRPRVTTPGRVKPDIAWDDKAAKAGYGSSRRHPDDCCGWFVRLCAHPNGTERGFGDLRVGDPPLLFVVDRLRGKGDGDTRTACVLNSGVDRSLTTSSVSHNLPLVATDRGAVIEALADPTRRSIFELLGGGPRSVVDITGEVPISRPAVSQHLRVLKDAGLVSVRAVGTRRFYALDPTGVRAARDYFDQFWTTALAAFAEAADATKEAQQ